jgi:hypothetical protein
LFLSLGVIHRLLIQRRVLLRLPHELKSLDSADLGARFGLERLGAERTAERDHPLAVFDSGKPFPAGEDFLADGAIDVFAADLLAS